MITHEGFKVHGLHKRAYLGFEFQEADPTKGLSNFIFYDEP